MDQSASEAQSEERSERRRNTALMVLVVIAILALVGFALKSMLGGHGTAAKKPPKISLLPTTPPPPPPPPKEEKKPEPPKEQKEVKMDQVEKKDQPPADPSLKMEGAAGDGPSAFAAGKVTSEDLSRIGAGGGAIGGIVRMQQSLFADRLQRHLQEELNRNRKLRETDYRVNLRLWLARDGRVQRAELVQSTGNADLDSLLQQALLQVAALRDALPENLQQPFRIRVTARGGR